MIRIVAGGTGFVGQHLIKHWLAQNINVMVIGRNIERIHQIFGHTVQSIVWQDFLANPEPHLTDCELVVNLAGANIGAKKWSVNYKKTLLQSRLETTADLASACALLGDKSPPLFNASGISVYGLHDATESLPSAATEETLIDETSTDFLVDLGLQWEAQTNVAKAHGVRVVLLRFAPILGHDSHIIHKLWWPYQLGLGGPVGNGKQGFTWVHIDDVIRAIDSLFNAPDAIGAFNIVAPEAINQKTFARALGVAMHRPAILPMPSFVVKQLFGEMGEQLLLKGQHVVPERLTELGFKFTYPTIATALVASLKKL